MALVGVNYAIAYELYPCVFLELWCISFLLPIQKFINSTAGVIAGFIVDYPAYTLIYKHAVNDDIAKGAITPFG